jgi:hypothetical protein
MVRGAKAKTKKMHLMLAYTRQNNYNQQPKRYANAMPDVRWLHARCLCRGARLGEVDEGLTRRLRGVLHDLRKCE